MPELPAEADLRALARRFEESERRVRALVAEAIDGDRRRLLREILLVLAELRTLDVGQAVESAYVGAARAVNLLTKGEPGNADVRAVRDLAGSLAKKLDEGPQEAARRAREAIVSVTSDNLEDAQHEAVTAHVDDDGRRLPLGSYAAMETNTIGRHASSRGIRDAVGDGLVTISSHGTNVPVCIPIEGVTMPASSPLPPYHPGCGHTAYPAGFGQDSFLSAASAVA